MHGRIVAPSPTTIIMRLPYHRYSPLLLLALTSPAWAQTPAQPLDLRHFDTKTPACADFYQHANAMGAAWSFGATDKTMLIRISNMVTEYLRSNYTQTVAVPISQAPDISN